jgi:hypothetical protein
MQLKSKFYKTEVKEVSAYYKSTCEDMKHATGIINACTLDKQFHWITCDVQFYLSFACHINSQAWISCVAGESYWMLTAW